VGRYFFAIWPEAPAARELARVGESLSELVGGKPTPAQKIHITLAFLGVLDDGGLGGAVSAAGRIRGSAISMAMDSVGSFRRAKVGWAAPSARVARLVRLQAKLADALRDAGFRLEEREFNPHATLVRKIGKPVPPAPMPPVEWSSNGFTLVESTGDGRYEVRESWALRGD